MNNRMNDLSDEVKANLVNCKTEEEKKKVLADAGIEPIDDELLDEVAGGFIRNNNNRGGQSKRPDPRNVNLPGRVEKL
ncbi:MAG: hypothetical protein K5655_04920 [Lachnospiraceae bacterium]|nr:hypothetical protein [Lachnospiraceae bacterium]